MIEAVLAGLARANLAAAAAILLVLLIRKPARRLFGARAAYGLWSIPALTILAMFAPHPAVHPLITPIVMTAQAMADEVTAQAPAAVRTAPDLAIPLFALWLLGVAAAAGLLLSRQSRFVASLGRLEPVTDAGPRRLRAQYAGIGPAVVGALRPRIVTPADFEIRFAPHERDVILAHEQVHLACGDARINAFAAAVQCVAWFNPLVYLGVRLLRVDQELACDAAVLGRFPSARRLYAEVLLKTQLATQPLPLGCHWPAGAAHPLKERIVMLKSPLPGRFRKIAGVAVVALLSLGGAAVAWAAQPGAPGVRTHLEPAEAAKLVGPGQTLDCKPDANRELHNCEIKGTPFAVIATADDVAREWPAAAKKAHLTGWVVLRCTPNLTTGRLDGCEGYHYGGAAETSPELKTAFERAAVRVAAVIRLKTPPGPNDFVMHNRPGFFTIEFSDHPSLPGGRPVNPPTRFPDYLPGPPKAAPARVTVPAEPQPAVRASVSYAPPAQTRPAGEPALITQPIWIRKPTAEDFGRRYPVAAAQRGVSGRVTMTCRIGDQGQLTDCKVAEADLGEAITTASDLAPSFVDATLKLFPLFQMEPKSRDGQDVAGGVIRIPVRWTPPQAAGQP